MPCQVTAESMLAVTPPVGMQIIPRSPPTRTELVRLYVPASHLGPTIRLVFVFDAHLDHQRYNIGCNPFATECYAVSTKWRALRANGVQEA